MKRANPFTSGAIALALIALALLVPAPRGTIILYLLICLGAGLAGAGRAVWLGLLVVAPLRLLQLVMH